jgi:hypothetical protein
VDVCFITRTLTCEIQLNHGAKSRQPMNLAAFASFSREDHEAPVDRVRPAGPRFLSRLFSCNKIRKITK